MASEPVLRVVFFRTESGREPVREWLLELEKEDRKVIGEDVKLVQFRWPLGMPRAESTTRNPKPETRNWKLIYGKYGATWLEGVLHGSASRHDQVRWCCSMAISRRPRRRHRKTLNWLAIERTFG